VLNIYGRIGVLFTWIFMCVLKMFLMFLTYTYTYI